MVLEAAINGQAEALVTYNVRDFAFAGERFGIAVFSPSELLKKVKLSSKSTYPLKLPMSVKKAAQRLAKEDGVSLNQWIAVAVAEKVGVVETAADFFKKRAGKATGAGLIDSAQRAEGAI